MTQRTRSLATRPVACGCGCGATTTRRYRPGHDARHKSALFASLTTGTWHQRTAAADLLADLGWDHLAPLAALRPIPYRTGTLATVAAADVTRWQYDHLGQGHANRRCPRLTAAARLASGTNATTRLASDAYVTLSTTRPQGWDACEACSHEHTRDEVAEYRAMTKATTLDPADLAAKARAARTRANRKARRLATPAPWQNPTPAWDPPTPPTPTNPTRPLTPGERADLILARLGLAEAS